MGKKTSILNKSKSLLKEQYNSGESSNNNDILELQKKTMKLTHTQFINNDSENLQSVSPPIRFSVKVKVEPCDPEDTIQDDLFTINPDPNSSIPEAYGTNVIKVDSKYADAKLPNFLAGECSEGIPIDTETTLQEEVQCNTCTLSNPNIINDVDGDVIILDKDDEPSRGSALYPKYLNNKDFHIKTMQTQLDEEIKRHLEVEVNIYKLFQTSKSYRLLMGKEPSEKKPTGNTSRNKESKMKEVIEKMSVTNELLEKGSTMELTPKESLQMLMEIDENEDMFVSDLIIVDNGVEDINTMNDSEGEVPVENNSLSEINSDTITVEQELKEINVNKVGLKNSVKKESHLDSEDVIMDCYSSNSKQLNWDISTIGKKESLIKDDTIVVEPEVNIQTKVKLVPSECLMKKEYDRLQMIADNKETIKTKSKNQIYKCKGCGYCAVLNQYIVHVSTKCPSTEFSCNSCKKFVQFKNLKHYLKHLPVHNYKRLSCPECQDQRKSSNDLYTHVNTHIQNLFSAKKPIEPQKMSLYYCKKCGNCVPFEYFFGHWQMHWNGQGSVPEEYSSLEDSSDNDQDDSSMKSMSPKVVEEVMKMLQIKARPRLLTDCIVCLRKSSRWQECKRHLIEHLLVQAIYTRKKLKSEILKCYFCDKEFEMEDDWKFHTREHSHLRVYTCELCQKRFSDSSNLSKHKKSHNLFSFVCDLCGGKFNTKRCLILHMQMHEKTLQCEFCNMAFVRPGKLRAHILRKHSTNKLGYPCRICKIKFLTWKEKLQHMWVKHGTRKVRADCPLCERRYRKFSDLKRHMIEKHDTVYTQNLQ